MKLYLSPVQYDLVIVGGGAAGFFAAAQVLEKFSDCKILMLEKSKKYLAKVKVSGGGRCNVTNVIEDKNDFSKSYPRGEKWLKQSLYSWSNQDMVNYCETNGLTLKTEADGRIFPVSNNSQDVIDLLVSKTIEKGMEIRFSESLKSYGKSDEGFVINTNHNEYKSKFLLVATGGQNKPDLPSYLGISKEDWQATTPSLFTFHVKEHLLHELSGLSVENAEVKVNKSLKSNGPLLITHWGYSGPAVLKLSALGAFELASQNYSFNIEVNWLSESYEACQKQLISTADSQGKKLIYNAFPYDLPKRLLLFLIKRSGISEDKKWSELSKKERNKLVNELVQGIYTVSGKSLFKDEFVSAGGVKLNALKAKSLEHKSTDGLYFAGEIVNVDGITGGFNFQNAWSGAYLVANDIVKKLKNA